MFSLLPTKLARASQTLLHKLRENERHYYMALAILWQAFGLALALKIYLNGPHAVSHSGKELFSTAVELLCLFVCLLWTCESPSSKNSRAFPSGSRNLAEGPNIGHEHANLISITKYFHGHRNHTRQCLQKFKPRISNNHYYIALYHIIYFYYCRYSPLTEILAAKNNIRSAQYKKILSSY